MLEVEEWLPGDPRFATIPDGSVWPRAAGALVATVQFNLGTSWGRDAYAQVKQWHENGEAAFSIGFKVPPGGASKRHDGVRIIHDLDLFEVSPVLHGANTLTRSLEVKAFADGGQEGLEHKATWSAVELKAAESSVGSGVMVALKLQPDVAAKIARPDGTPAEHLHITLAYLGDAANLGGHPDDLRDIVAPAVTGSSPLAGTIGGIGRFPDTGDGEPTWVPVDVPGLAELRQRVVDALRTSAYADKLDSRHGYTPHITLGYGLPEGAPVAATPVTFEQIAVVRGADTSFVPLAPAAEEAPAPGQAPAAQQPPVETKSAAQLVLEAKAAHPAARIETKSAARIVLEAKSLPSPETAAMRPMPLSYEQLHARLADSVRRLFKNDEKGTSDGWVCVEATFPDHVVVTQHNDDTGSTTFSVPYVIAGREIDLGKPAEVELTTVALPVTGDTHGVSGSEETEARFVQPTAVALDDATALIEVSDAGPAHLEHLKPKINQLLATLAKKGLPMDKHNSTPSRSSLNLWDDDYDVTDGWDDDEPEPDTDDTGVPQGNTPDAPPAEEGDDTAVPPGNTPGTTGSGKPDDADLEDDTEEVRLDADEVKATLASLAL
ncbi:2'-5' RNA ligase family protein [Streptomyces sp. NPDC057249]|uniref:2'-5' RNA ligase family protein n=1 Tax=Streptomyces sp. NPDC057249 TaxID=3346067 RepID=UPI0036396665